MPYAGNAACLSTGDCQNECRAECMLFFGHVIKSNLNESCRKNGFCLCHDLWSIIRKLTIWTFLTLYKNFWLTNLILIYAKPVCVQNLNFLYLNLQPISYHHKPLHTCLNNSTCSLDKQIFIFHNKHGCAEIFGKFEIRSLHSRYIYEIYLIVSLEVKLLLLYLVTFQRFGKNR